MKLQVPLLSIKNVTQKQSLLRQARQFLSLPAVAASTTLEYVKANSTLPQRLPIREHPLMVDTF